MRIAHCVTVAPNRCGLYGTARDLVMAERKAGIDAGFIDATMTDPNTPLINGVLMPLKEPMKDKSLPVSSLEWADEADIYVRHSFIPVKWQNIGKPLIMAVHGRPESSFRLEQTGKLAAISTFHKRGNDPRYKQFWCFWPEYMDIWSTIIPPEKMVYIPAPVDLDYYHPEGPKRDLKDREGSPNIVIADIWREDIIPFNMIFAAHRFWRKYCRTAKIHIVALQGNNLKILAPVIKQMKDDGSLGYISFITSEVTEWYRSADIFITPQTIATRTVREPLACGVPVVAGSGNKYTPYSANPNDIEAFARAINECWIDYQQDRQTVKQVARQTAEIAFNLKNTGKAVKEALKKL